LAARRYVSPFDIGLVHLALNETETGFEWLAKALQDRWFEMMFMRADPRFDPYRADPRYISVCDRVGLL
jgi:serine/threonine-protein kinase